MKNQTPTSNQLGLFEPRKPVQRPGLRGGKFYITETGHIRYGEAPAGRAEFTGEIKQALKTTILPHSGMFSDEFVNNPGDAAWIFRAINDLDRERVCLLHLDKDRRPIAFEVVSQGALATSIVHPRDTLKNAVNLGTHAVVICHNHPSGDPVPSKEDLEITMRVSALAEQLGIQWNGHIVIGKDDYVYVSPGPIGRWEITPYGAQPVNTEAPYWRLDRPQHSATTNEIPGVEGRLVRDIPASNIINDLLNKSVHGPDDAAALARAILEPGSNRMALLILINTANRVIGAFPVAHDEIDAAGLKRAILAVMKTSASGCVLVGGEDGPEWEHNFRAAAVAMDDIAPVAGFRFMDGVRLRAEKKEPWVFGDEVKSKGVPVKDAERGHQLAKETYRRDKMVEREGVFKSLWYLRNEDMLSAGWLKSRVLERQERQLQAQLDAIDRELGEGR